jgi:hypothetical protein
VAEGFWAAFALVDEILPQLDSPREPGTGEVGDPLQVEGQVLIGRRFRFFTTNRDGKPPQKPIEASMPNP